MIGPVANINRTFAVAVRLSASRKAPLATALRTDTVSDGTVRTRSQRNAPVQHSPSFCQGHVEFR